MDTPESGDEGELVMRFLETPRAVGVAGILFALTFGAIIILFRSVLPLDPQTAGV